MRFKVKEFIVISLGGGGDKNIECLLIYHGQANCEPAVLFLLGWLACVAGIERGRPGDRGEGKNGEGLRRESRRRLLCGFVALCVRMFVAGANKVEGTVS